MTVSTAQAVATSITNGGHQASINPILDSGVIVGWEVIATSVLVDVTINQAKTLQDAHSVLGTVQNVVYR